MLLFTLGAENIFRDCDYSVCLLIASAMCGGIECHLLITTLHLMIQINQNKHNDELPYFLHKGKDSNIINEQ